MRTAPENKPALIAPLAHLTRHALAGIRYRVTATIVVEAATGKAPVLLALVLRDGEGALCTDLPDGMAHSEVYGPYVYLGSPGRDGRHEIAFEFTAPPGCAEAEIALHRWRAGSVTISRGLRLRPVDAVQADAEADARLGDKILHECEVAIRPGESYAIGLTLPAGRRLNARDALAAFRFFDAEGGQLAPPSSLPVSSIAGPFLYFTPDPEDPVHGQAALTVPPHAVRMRVRAVRWMAAPDFEIEEVGLTWLGDPDSLSETGEALIEPGAWYALSGRMLVSGGSGNRLGLLHLLFRDGHGVPVAVQAEGLVGAEQLLNSQRVDLPEPEMISPEGAIPLTLAFRAPPGAAHVEWRLRPDPGNWSMTSQQRLSLRSFSDRPGDLRAELPAAQRACGGLDAAQLSTVDAALPDAPIWRAAGLGRYSLVAEAICAQEPGTWVAFEASLDTPAEAARIWPVYFDAEGKVLKPAALPGCALQPETGLCRDAVLRPNGGPAATLSEAFRAPERTALAAYFLFVRAIWDLPACSAVAVRAITPDAVAHDLPVSSMTAGQLRAAAELAEAVWNQPARHALYSALALVDPGAPGHADRARRLNDHLIDLDTGWLPRLAPRPTYAPRPDSILHLLKVIAPDESSGGAVRSASILEAQAARGLHPVAVMPLVSTPADIGTPPPPDGPVERLRNGVTVAYTHYPALQPAQIPPHRLLEFETDQAEAVARRHRAGLVHAASGFRGYETALKGLAIARAHDLPMVYEVRSFHEHTWRPVNNTDYGDTLTHLRMAQENRCMAEADVVVTISKAMVENLHTRGIARERLFCVPNAISEEFLTLADPGEVAALRARLGLGDRRVLGYISNFSGREGHMLLLEAFAALVAAGQDLALVLPGEGPERAAVRQRAHRIGLADRVILPGNVPHAEIRAWYRLIDLFVVPRIADFASDYVTPLKPFEAMSQGVPVLMSDRPVASEIAGSGAEARAGLFATGDTAALTSAITDLLAADEARAMRARLARDWVLRERVWSQLVARYDEIYAEARHRHAAARKAR